MDLPAPFGPTTPMRSPRRMRRSKPSNSVRPAALRREVLRVDDDVTGARRRREAEAHALRDRPHVFGALDAIELVEHLAPALRLAALLPRDVLADEVLGLVDERLLPLEDGALAREIIGAGDGVRAVAQGVHAEAARAELHGLRGDGIEERAVVRDHEHGAAVRAEPALEPRDGVEVEVVRRLVEHEQIGLEREDDAEVQAAALAAGERSDRPRQVGVREAELRGDGRDGGARDRRRAPRGTDR